MSHGGIIDQFSLEHFYFGQVVRDGKPDGKARPLAASSGLDTELMRLAVERVTLPTTRQPRLAWALMRGNRQLPFLLVHTQIGGTGQTIAHYILLPGDVLRQLGGRVHTLYGLLDERMPVFHDSGQRLKPLFVSIPEPQSGEDQADAILELMTLCQNRLDVIQRLLAAIVQNTQVVVRGAPPSVEARMQFVEGLLALLPPSVRFAVTFALHTTAAQDNDAQVRFIDGSGATQGEVVVYRWAGAALSGAEVSNDYAQFVISQLRLDTQLVIERTRALIPATGWRMRQGDRLAEALAYGSYRLKIDQALLSNLPVSKDDTARILRDDPTLSPELRASYAGHVLTFTLAMDDPEQADGVAVLLYDDPTLAQRAYQQLGDAIHDKQAGAAARMLLRWLNNGYALPDDLNWGALAQQAVTTQAETLAHARDIDGMNRFIVALQQNRADHPVIARVMPKLLESALPLATADADLARNMFLLGALHLDSRALRGMLDVRQFTERLHPALRQLLGTLRGVNPAASTPVGLLVSVAREFGEAWQPLVVTRLAELAVEHGRRDLLDLPTLRALTEATLDNPAQADRALRIVERLDPSELALLGEEGDYHLLRVLLASGAHDRLAAQMIRLAAQTYRGDRQLDYLNLVERLFVETSLPAAQAIEAVQGLSANGIKSAPLLMALMGSLHDRDPMPALDTLAAEAEAMLGEDTRLLQVVPPTALLTLLAYHARADNPSSALRVAQVIPQALQAQEADALPVVTQMYRLMRSRKSTQAAGLDIVRAYVRQADDKAARVAIAYYARELGGDVRAALDATYALKRLMGGRDLIAFSEAVRASVPFLLDTASAYADSRTTPDIPPLMRGLSEMGGNFLREDLRAFTLSLMALMQSMVMLHQQHRASRPRDVDGLLRGTLDPVSGLDMLRVAAGAASQGKRVDVQFLTPPLAYPLGQRSRRALADEVRVVAELVNTWARAFTSNPPGSISARHLRDETASLLRAAPDAARAAAQQTLSRDLQVVIGLLEFIGDSGDPRAADDQSQIGKKLDTLKQRPRSVLEFYRFLYAYFRQRG